MPWSSGVCMTVSVVDGQVAEICIFLSVGGHSEGLFVFMPLIVKKSLIWVLFSFEISSFEVLRIFAGSGHQLNIHGMPSFGSTNEGVCSLVSQGILSDGWLFSGWL